VRRNTVAVSLQRSRFVGSNCRAHRVTRIAGIAAGWLWRRQRPAGTAVAGGTRLARDHANGRCSSAQISGSDASATCAHSDSRRQSRLSSSRARGKHGGKVAVLALPL